jgi:hypothetical protein
MADRSYSAAEVAPVEPPVSAFLSHDCVRAFYESLQGLGMPRVNLLFMGGGSKVSVPAASEREACAPVLPSGGSTSPVGADDIVWWALAARQDLWSPMATWNPGEPLDLPDVQNVRTLLLRDVGAMGASDQRRLLDWLGQAVGRTQVISTSNEALLPRVRNGQFLNALYYRLNTVCIELVA